ncbi:MAG TPA: ABC transporter ATP-binding protein [Eubacteriaceae bacterium]|nr:ABC transporter ATP-binding protein [Eubacteriaceae bacterium]
MIKAENVKKFYEDFRLECSITVAEGCVTGLIGRNGSGKTTLFKSILGLIHTDGGEVEIFGKKGEEIKKEEKEKMGVVLSDSGLSGYITIKNLVPILRALYKNFEEKTFLDRCSQFELPMNKKIKELSTGMKRKLHLIIAISHQSSILILDEPTAGLDVIARDEMLHLLREYMEKYNPAVLISSHISSDIEGFCDEVYMIEDGKILLHEETPVLLDEYAVLKVSQEQYKQLDRAYILSDKKESYGYKCLTNNRRYYLEQDPDIIIEKGSIDELIHIMIGGKRYEGASH